MRLAPLFSFSLAIPICALRPYDSANLQSPLPVLVDSFRGLTPPICAPQITSSIVITPPQVNVVTSVGNLPTVTILKLHFPWVVFASIVGLEA